VELSGGHIVVQCLKDEGVEFLFGYPGGAVLHIYDAFFTKTMSSMFWSDMSRRLHSADAYAQSHR
jgi:acetolactate synthase I/II/III large subunit